MDLFSRWRKRGDSLPVRGSHDATVMMDEHSPTGPGTMVVPELAEEAIEMRVEAARAQPERAAPARAELARPAPARAAAPARPSRSRVVGVVVAVEGEFEGTALPLFEGSNRIGRDGVCELCLPSENVAPQHACIDYRAGFFRVEPLGEAEIRVNLEPRAECVLRDGDVLQIGRTTLRFRSIVGG